MESFRRISSLVVLGSIVVACSGTDPQGPATKGGAANGTGGNTGNLAATGGSSAVSATTGGTVANATGGSPTGGAAVATGGRATGGAPVATGGSPTGGTLIGSGGTVAAGGTVASGGSGGAAAGSSSIGTKASDGCGKAAPTLKSATAGQATPVNTISVGGKSREFLVRWPSDYKNNTPYRLHIGLHGYGGNLSENGKDNFGLWSLSKNSTIFVTLAAVGGSWDATADLAYADAVLKQVESELCIDTSRVMLEGFSMGGAMAWIITCSRAGVYRAVVGHSGGGVSPVPSTCSPVAYLGSLGLSDISGNSQATQTDQFGKANGCTIENLPTAPKGGHICTNYKGCPTAFPVVWCSYDGGHGFQPTDSGQSSTWMPAEVWSFLSPL